MIYLALKMIALIFKHKKMYKYRKLIVFRQHIKDIKWLFLNLGRFFLTILPKRKQKEQRGISILIMCLINGSFKIWNNILRNDFKK